MIGLYILLAHLAGDYLIQTNAMANKKTSSWLWAVLHGITYTLPYLLITLNPWALLIIAGTHIVIDRYRLVKHFIWFKEHVTGSKLTWQEARGNNGYSQETPVWMSTWLMIIIDNAVHLIINTIAIGVFVL